MKEIKCVNGVIKYQQLNFADVMILMGEVGIGTKELSGQGKNFDFIVTGRIAKAISPFVEVKIKGIKDYDALLSSTEYAKEIGELVSAFLIQIQSFSGEKKSD